MDGMRREEMFKENFWAARGMLHGRRRRSRREREKGEKDPRDFGRYFPLVLSTASLTLHYGTARNVGLF